MQTTWQHRSITYYGLQAHHFSNGVEALTVVPALSGRAMFYGPQNGPNLLFEFKEQLALVGQPALPTEWRNYGGYKCWLAPQELSGWPPDPAIDGAVYTDSLHEDELGWRLDLQGPPSVAFGVQMQTSYQLNHHQSGLTVVQGFENYSQQTVEWSAWDVTQVNAPGYAILPQGQIFNFPDFPYKPQIENVGNYCRVKLEGQPPEFKLGVQGDTATLHQIAYQPENVPYSLVKKFEPIPNQNFPHNNPLEVYNCHLAPYGEIEINSPLVKLKPGERYQFKIMWNISRTTENGA